MFEELQNFTIQVCLPVFLFFGSFQDHSFWLQPAFPSLNWNHSKNQYRKNKESNKQDHSNKVFGTGDRNSFLSAVSLRKTGRDKSLKQSKSKETKSQGSENPLEEYKKALNLKNPEKDCKTLKKLSQMENFILHELSSIRFNQHCEKKSDWKDLKIKNKVLIPFFYQAWFQTEMNQKKFKKAYGLYKKNEKQIPVTPKEFEKLAGEILKTKLTKTEREELIKKLQKQSPRLIPFPQKKDFIRVAYDYRKNRQFKKALFYYKKIKNNQKADIKNRWLALKGIRKTYKLRKWTKMKEYISSSKEWADFLKNKDFLSKPLISLHHKSNIEYIRTLWTERGQKKAQPILNRLEKELKGHFSLQLVYWLKGRMAEEKKQYEKAVFWLNKAKKEKSFSDKDRERILWSLAWNQRRIKNFQESQKNLERLEKTPEITLFAKSQYLYWMAENFKSMKNFSEAEKLFKDLVELDLYGYYGALAHRKLKTPLPSIPKTKWNEKDFLEFFQKTDKDFFKALIHVKERTIAQSMVLERVKTDRKWDGLTWLNYMVLLQKSGAYLKSFEVYHRLSNKNQRMILEKHPSILFPEPYGEIVDDSAEKEKISPALIYSIMKQESGFDIKARSFADAFGLLQILPQVAEKLSKDMVSVKYKKPEDLFKPEVAIPFGAKRLSQLFKKFNSYFIPSIASYNANEKAVLNWIQSRFHGEPLVFIEDIPYHETKNYVRLVMGNYITYHRLGLSEGTDEEGLTFPEACLGGLEEFKTH